MAQFGVDFNYAYDGKLLTEVLFKPTGQTPAITEMARIIPSVKFKVQIPRVASLDKVLKLYTDCARTVTGNGININNTTVELSNLEMFIEQCKDDLEGTIGNVLAEDWLRNGIEENNIEGTPFQTIINTLLQDSLRRDVFRIFSFGDKLSVSTDYDQIDGLWNTLIANSGSGASYCVRKVATLGVGALSSGEAIAALEAAYVGSAVILKEIPNNQKYFHVTGSVYENLLASYEANVNGTERQFTMLTNGADSLNYRGIAVVPVYAWDTALLDTANPLFGTVEHLIHYSTKENHVVAVGNAGDLNRIGGWYDRDSRKYKFESMMRMGYNYVHCDLSSIAY
jgi:hypothetical protein